VRDFGDKDLEKPAEQVSAQPDIESNVGGDSGCPHIGHQSVFDRAQHTLHARALALPHGEMSQD
jgi:hypothetical protein